MQEDREPGEGELESLRSVLEAAGDHEGVAAAWETFSGISFAGMRAEAAAAATLRAAYEYRLAGNRAAEDSRRAWALMLISIGPEDGPSVARRCQKGIDDPGAGMSLRAMALDALALVRAGEGRFDEAHDLFAQSRRVLDELRLPFPRALGGFTLAAILRMAGDEPGAEAAVRESLAFLDSIGELAYAAGFKALLAQILEAQDRDEEAIEMLGRTVPPFGYDAVLHRVVRAKILAKRSAPSEAIELGMEALALIDATDQTALRAETRLELASVLALADRGPEARAMATEAGRLYREKGVQVMADRAEQFAALGRPSA
jgi:tetratricopeptide (TPR) repeat protein